MIIGKFIYRVIGKLNAIMIAGKVLFYYKHVFRYFGKGSTIINPIILNNPQNIIVGNNVTILNNAWLSGPKGNMTSKLVLKIDNYCAIGNYCHIYATEGIHIEEKVLIADKVYISDNLHNYTNINVPVIDQSIIQLSAVIIGKGSWIGENVCIIGASIGKNCVIGANAVVTKDIPDYSIAVGIPARVIKKYNQQKGIWQKVE